MEGADSMCHKSAACSSQHPLNEKYPSLNTTSYCYISAKRTTTGRITQKCSK